MSRRVPIVAAVVLVAASCGCSRRPAWNDDPRAGTAGFWLDRPAAARVESRDYRGLWDAADDARRRFRFPIARDDYRGGLLTTEAVVSPQPFEVWRDELRTASARSESALAATRRSLRFEFGRLGGGGFFVEPKVVVERQSRGERRVTNAIDYRGVLGEGRQRTERGDEPATTRPTSYWYAVGRDAALERSLANRIARRVGSSVRSGPAEDVERRAAEDVRPPQSLSLPEADASDAPPIPDIAPAVP